MKAASLAMTLLTRSKSGQLVWMRRAKNVLPMIIEIAATQKDPQTALEEVMSLVALAKSLQTEGANNAAGVMGRAIARDKRAVKVLLDADPQRKAVRAVERLARATPERIKRAPHVAAVSTGQMKIKDLLRPGAERPRQPRMRR
ncbi:MAG: hypothetical protein RIT81_13480 [Deltaproteobacteria bacterium]